MGGRAAVAGSGGVLRARLRRRAPAAATVAAIPEPPPPGVERVAATAAARAAGRAGGLHATAEAVAAQGISLAELPELLPERALIAVIESGDRLGVAALCPAFLASLIEMQAIGRVTARPVGARRATRADAALAAEFVNHLLEEVGRSVAGLPGHGALAGYRYASYLDDPRPLGLMLDDTGLRALRIELRLGAGGERRGTLFVAVPATAAGDAPAALATLPAIAASDGQAAAPPAVATKPPSLAAAVRDAPVPLVAVLCRRQITLRELRALRPGATIALPRAALDGASLETARGQKLARGRLGEADGFHALRLRHRDAPCSASDAAFPAAAGLVVPDLPQVALQSLPQTRAGDPATVLAAEPPIADLTGPDPFRAEAHGGGAQPGALPLQLVSG